MLLRKLMMDGGLCSRKLPRQVDNSELETSWSMQHLEARGVLTESLGGTIDALITIFSEAEPNVRGGEIHTVGAVLAVRPHLAVVVSLAPDEFGLLATMMLAGRLASAHLVFQEPKYGKGLVASASFSTQSPEIA